jgi:hypothetical protein
MDEEGYEFGEAVKEAMAQGYKNGGLMIAIKNLAQGGMTYGDKTYHQYHDQYVPPDSEAMGYANGGGIGSMMIPTRQGLFMGGPPLTGEALNIYSSMNAYGYTDQEIADRLSGLNLYDPNVTTPPTTPPPTTPPSGGGGGGGGGGGDGGGGSGPTTTTTTTKDPNTFNADTFDDKTIIDKFIDDKPYSMKDIAGDSLPFNFDTTDVGNPTNDPRVVSEELGITGFGKPNMRDIAGDELVGTIAPSTGGITTIDKPNMRDIAGPSTTVDESISIEDLSKPSNIGDFKITAAPDLTNLSGILKAPPSIGLAQDPDVQYRS